MAKSLWLPVLIGMGVLLLGTLLIFAIPETLYYHTSTTSETLLPDSASDTTVTSTKPNDQSFFVAAKNKCFTSLKQTYDSTTVLHSFPILLLLCTFILQPFTTNLVELCLRYISKRFSWRLYETGFLLTLRAAVNLLLLLAILPLLSHFLTARLHFTSKAKDLFLAQISAVLLAIGALMIAISPTVIGTIIGLTIFTLGLGFIALVRAIITMLVDKQHVGRLFAAIAVVERAGALAAGPVLGAMYSVGLEWKGSWLGLPFFAVAAICFLGAVAVWLFGILARREEELVEGDEEQRESLLDSAVPTVPVSVNVATPGVVSPLVEM